MEYETISGEEVHGLDARREDHPASRTTTCRATRLARPCRAPAAASVRPAAPAPWSRSRSPDRAPLYRATVNRLDAAAGSSPRPLRIAGSRQTMQRSIYVRPVGLFPAPADAAEDAWSGLPLAGQPLRFAAVEVATREGARVSRRIVALGDAFERDWGRGTLARCAGSRGDHQPAPAPRRPGARPPAHHGHRQRDAGQLLRRRAACVDAGGHRARAAARRGGRRHSRHRRRVDAPGRRLCSRRRGACPRHPRHRRLARAAPTR